MGGELSRTQQAEVLRTEQRRRWQDGDRVTAETLLARHPELQADPECAAELLYNEVLLREESGEAPDLGEYLRRFPHLAPLLQPLFEVHQAVFRGDLFATNPAPGARPGPEPATPAAARPSVPATKSWACSAAAAWGWCTRRGTSA